MKSFGYWLVSVSVVLGLLVAACGTPQKGPPAPTQQSPGASAPTQPTGHLTREQQLVAAAKAAGEKEVVIWINTWNPGPVEKAFEAKYPFLKLTPLKLGAAELQPRVLEEYKAGKHSADVVASIIISDVVAFQKAGVLGEYDYPNWPNTWPNQPKNNLWRFDQATIRLPVYNKNTVLPQDVPKSWDDLNNAKWRGRSMVSISGSSFLVGYAYEMGDLTKDGVNWDKTVSFWKKVIDTVRPRVGSGFQGPNEMLAAGDVDLLLLSASVSAFDNMVRGAPVDFVPFKKAYADPWALAMFKDPPHANGAKLLMDFLTSEEGAAIFANMEHNVTLHPQAAKKVTSNAFFAGKGTEIFSVPIEWISEQTMARTYTLWVNDIIGR